MTPGKRTKYNTNLYQCPKCSVVWETPTAGRPYIEYYHESWLKDCLRPKEICPCCDLNIDLKKDSTIKGETKDICILLVDNKEILRCKDFRVRSALSMELKYRRNQLRNG